MSTRYRNFQPRLYIVNLVSFNNFQINCIGFKFIPVLLSKLTRNFIQIFANKGQRKGQCNVNSWPSFRVLTTSNLLDMDELDWRRSVVLRANHHHCVWNTNYINYYVDATLRVLKRYNVTSKNFIRQHRLTSNIS